MLKLLSAVFFLIAVAVCRPPSVLQADERAATRADSQPVRFRQNIPLNLSRWKSTTATPRVRWQNDDFNDREPVLSPDNGRPHVKKQVRRRTWIPVADQSRQAEGRFQFRDADHVVLLGGTFIERAQQYGHLECALNRGPGTKVTFRNLGWSADTVFAESRGIFDAPAQGYERMIEHVRAEEPNVVILCYGQNEAMSSADGGAGIDRFRRQLRKLHADLSATGAEVIFLTPHPFVTPPPPLFDPSRWNERLQTFADAVQQEATAVGAVSVDLFSDFHRDMERQEVLLGDVSMLPIDEDLHPELTRARNSVATDNGMHWNETGYRSAATIVAARLTGTDIVPPQITIDTGRSIAAAKGGTIRNVQWNPSEQTILQLEFRPFTVSPFPIQLLTPATSPPFRVMTAPLDAPDGRGPMRMAGVAEDGRTPQAYISSTTVTYERLRELTIRKNQLYFHRWRPQNITYLFGFRKHEQGNNASEIAQFDPLITALEEEIQEARRPRWHKVTVHRVD